jgi:peptide deformylase
MELKLVKYSNPVLYKPTQEVISFDDDIRKLVKALEEEILKSNGAGIAAPQLGVDKQVFVIKEEYSKDHTVFINPKLEFSNPTETCIFKEGCLSFPGISINISRPKSVKVTAFDLEGDSFTIEDDHILSRIIQHEYDHLIGKTMLSHVGPMKRRLLKSKLKKTGAPKRLFE